MHLRFWGTRGSIPTPGHETAFYGGNTSCVEIRTNAGTHLILDCGTGIRALGMEMLRQPGPYRIHLLIGHTHWDHIQGFPFFTPAFLPASELNIYGSAGFQRSLEDSLSGQMQYAYFPVKLQDVASRIHYTELEEGFFRIGEILVETQYLNHTAPTVAFRISADGATVAYVTDHEPFWNFAGSGLRHPGDQRHIDFLRGADVVIHDAQYTSEEYVSKIGWGHSPVDYVTDVAVAAEVKRLALFHHDPMHDDDAIKRIVDAQCSRVEAAGIPLEVFAAREGMAFEVEGDGSGKTQADTSALERRPIAGGRVMIVGAQTDLSALEQVLPEDGLLTTSVSEAARALETATVVSPDLIIMSSSDNDGTSLIQRLREALQKPDLPVILLTDRSADQQPHSSTGSATDYLARPFSPPMLRTRIRVWLARTIGISGTPGQSRLLPSKSETRDSDSDEQSTPPDVVEVLASVPLFASLTTEQRLQFITRSIDQKFPPDHTIIRQGDAAGMVYVILSGHVRVFESVPDSSMQLSLGELGPGQIFGESGVLRDRPRSSSVVTLEATRCLVIPPAEFLELLGQSKEVALAVMRLLAGRLYQSERLLARHAPDPLTGLLGRRAFHELYRKLAAGSRRRRASVLLLIFDILHLKEINDRFGYSAGDEVLRTVADALVECSRSTDLVTRYGGDEFTLLLVEAAATDAEAVMQRVQQKLRQLAVYRNLPLTVECRMGYAASNNPPDTAEEFLRIADEDMQRKRPAPSK